MTAGDTPAPSDRGAGPRVVVLTHGGDYADRILLGLALADAPPEAILIAAPPRAASGDRALVRVLDRARARRVTARLLCRLAASVERDPFDETADSWPIRWSGLAPEVTVTGSLNDRQMVSDVRAARPDYLVLAGLGIVSAEVLAVPTRGTLNVHPALLPWVRGVGVIERSIERRVPVGVTAHHVDAGVDTGALIRRELVPRAGRSGDSRGHARGEGGEVRPGSPSGAATPTAAFPRNPRCRQ